jgi:hypothetical protein
MLWFNFAKSGHEAWPRFYSKTLKRWCRKSENMDCDISTELSQLMLYDAPDAPNELTVTNYDLITIIEYNEIPRKNFGSFIIRVQSIIFDHKYPSIGSSGK